MGNETYREYVDYILAGILKCKPENVPDFIGLLKPSYFTSPVDRRLFQALISGERDLIALGKIARSNSRIAGMVVQDSYLSESTIRDFRESALNEKMREAIRTDDWDMVESVLRERKEDYTRDIIEEYEEYKKEYSELSEGDVMGMSTGIKQLDDATYGLIPGHIWVAGGYYGYGKTYLAINLINSVLEQDKRVLFFSLEMTATEIIQRLVALRTGMNLYETVGKLTEEQKEKRTEAEEYLYEKIRSGKLVIDDVSRDGDGVISKMMIEETKRHVDFVVLDYLQLLAGDDQYESLRRLTKQFQGATKKMKTTTLLLSQISNMSQREGKFSLVDGFKGAGDIGQIANVALRIIRERNMETGEFSDAYTLRLTKVRHAKPCSIEGTIKFPGGKISGEDSPIRTEREDTLDQLFGL